MYEATKAERKELIEKYHYEPGVIPLLDTESEKVRKGISIDMLAGVAVIEYQCSLQEIRKNNKKWWEFWK